MYKRGFHQAIPCELNASKEFEQIISVINQFQKGVSDQVKKKKVKAITLECHLQFFTNNYIICKDFCWVSLFM